MDSAVLLYWLRDRGLDPKALLFNYGQRHSKELESAKAVCYYDAFEHAIANISEINPLIHKGSQSGDEAPPDGHYTELTMKTTIVPNRNAIMLAIAVGHAVKINVDSVYFAAHGGDHTIYPDCRAQFVTAFSRAMELGNEWNPVRVIAPFTEMTKAELVKLGTELHVPFHLTWSCYKGQEYHCGTCGTCVERKEAFVIAGVEDPTEYA
jgi:7-cyano-7-deazaguanine synthase